MPEMHLEVSNYNKLPPSLQLPSLKPRVVLGPQTSLSGELQAEFLRRPPPRKKYQQDSLPPPPPPQDLMNGLTMPSSQPQEALSRSVGKSALAIRPQSCFGLGCPRFSRLCQGTPGAPQGSVASQTPFLHHQPSQLISKTKWPHIPSTCQVQGSPGL